MTDYAKSDIFLYSLKYINRFLFNTVNNRIFKEKCDSEDRTNIKDFD